MSADVRTGVCFFVVFFDTMVLGRCGSVNDWKSIIIGGLVTGLIAVIVNAAFDSPFKNSFGLSGKR